MNKRQHKQAQKKTWQKARQEADQATIEGKSWRDEQPHTDLSQTVIPLEPRYMFDAAGLATGAEVAVDTTAQAQADAAVDNTQLENVAAPATQNENDLFDALATVSPATNTQEIIFVDSAVDDYQTLLAGIDSNIEVVMLDANRDGVEQIAEVLSNRSDLSAIHIISHGDAGQLNLGNTTLTAASMQGEHADELAIIGQALNSEADILIYGCNFAEGEFGQEATESFAELTGADVAASDDLTGHASLGGDWDLEFISGDVGTVTVAAEAWENVLAPTPLSFTGANFVNTGAEDIYGGTSDNVDDRSVGDQYVFTNVDAGAQGGVDAVVTVIGYTYTDAITGADLSVGGTILPTLSTIDSGIGLASALSPTLAPPTGDGGNEQWTATITVDYYQTGTATSLLVDSFVTPFDIDGNGGTDTIREAVSVTAPVVSVIQNTPTFLTTDLTHTNGLTTIAIEQISSTNGLAGITPPTGFTGGTVAAEQFAATFEVQQAASFTIELKTITGVNGAPADTGRFNAIAFDSASFSLPNTLSVPIVDLDLNDSTGATDLDYQNATPYQAGDAGIPIADTDVSITDSDSSATDMQSATITLTNAQAGDILSVSGIPLTTSSGTLASGISFTGNGSGTINLTGIESIADYQDALQLILYSNTNSTTIDGSDRTIEVTVNNGDIDSPVATATIDVFGTPTVNTQTTTNTQPTITGTWDFDNGPGLGSGGLTVTVNGVLYTLDGAGPNDGALTTDANGNWSLNLNTAGQTLSVGGGPYDVEVSSTDGVNTADDQTSDEINIILNPEWSFTGDVDVLEGDTASYTLSLIGAESIPATQSVSVMFNTAGTATPGVPATNDYDLNQALIDAAATRAELSYIPGSFELVYTSPGTPMEFTDLTIIIDTSNIDGDAGDENYDLTITAGPSGSNTSTISTTDFTTNTTIYETLTAPTVTLNGNTVNFNEDGAAVDLFNTVSITDPESATQTIETVVFTVTNLNDGANEVLNIDGVAVQLTDLNTSTTSSGYTYLVNVTGTTATVTLTTTGATGAEVAAVIDGMTYQNNTGDAQTAGTPRVVTLESVVDSGESNNTATVGTDAATVTVVPQNDDPVVGAPVLPLAYTGGMPLLGTGFSVADIDAAGSDIQVIVSVDEGTIAGTIGNSGLTSLTPNGGNTQITLVGSTAEIDNYLKGLTSGTLTFTNAAPTIDTTVTVTANDLGNTGAGGGGNIINTGLVNTLANDAPVLDLDSSDGAVITTHSDTFMEGSGPVNITSGNVNLTDTEMDDVTLQIVAANIADGANEILNFGAGQVLLDGVNDAILNNVTVGSVVVDVFYTAATQTLLITDMDGNALSLSDATNVLEDITYQNDDGAATTAPAREFTITANDGASSNSAVSTISLTNVENPPVNTIGAQTVNEDVETSLTGISVNDSDGDIVSTTLTVANGILSATDFGGGVAGDGTDTLVLTGTQAQINAALATLTYQGDPGFNGSDTLTMVSADADGGTLDDTDMVTITVNSVNDVPVINTGNASNYTLNEGETTTAGTGTLFDSIDIDPIETTIPGDGAITEASIDITGTINGSDTLTINGTPITGLDTNIGATSIGSGHTYSINAGTLTITFAANTTPNDAETILNGITFTAASGDIATHVTTFTLNTVTDNGGTANGGSDTVTGIGLASQITVNAVNNIDFAGTGNSGAATDFTEDGAASGALFDITTLDTVEAGDDITEVVINLGNVEAGDTLTINGGSVLLTAGTVTGPDGGGYTYTVNPGGTTLTISHAGQTATNVETLLEGITFSGTSDDPTTAQRSFTIDTITDDSGTVDVTDVTATVDVTPVNDPPTVDLDDDDSSGTGAGGYDDTFTVGGSAVNITDTDVVLEDLDHSTDDVFLLDIDAGNILDGANEILNFGVGNQVILDGATTTYQDVTIPGVGTDVDITYNTGTHLIEVRDSTGGSLTLAQATAVLEAITYQNDAVTPDTSLARTFAVTLNDGTDTSNIATSSINVSVDTNDEPIVTTLAGVNDTFTEGDGATSALFSNSDIDTIEAGQNIDQLVFTVSNVTQGANESLNLDGTSVTLTNGAVATGANYDISVSVSGATATVTLTASTLDTVAASTADGVIEGVTYSNTSTPPTTLDRVVTLTTIVDSGSNVGANDNVNDTVNVSSTITMVATTPDLDGDGEADATDLDDDNDGILDTDEDTAVVPSVEVLNVSGLQTNSYTVTEDGPVTITITGGDGGDEDFRTGGQGATVTATFNMLAGEEIVFVVGEAGVSNDSDEAGGGGSTGVYIGDPSIGLSSYRLVMVAGGGGGGEGNGTGDGQGGQAGTAGGDENGDSFAGGTNGDGGTTGASAGGGGGVGPVDANGQPTVASDNDGDDTDGDGDGENGGGTTSGGGLADIDPTDGLTVALGGTTNADGGDGFTAGGAGSGGEAGGGGGYSGGGAGGTDDATDGGGGGGSFLYTADSAYVSGSITAGADGGGTQSDGTLVILVTSNDTDSDSINNSRDLDSDNDGISDLRESGATATVYNYDTNNDGTISVAEGIAAGGTLTNGVWDFFGDDGATTSGDGTTLLDSDADTVDDYLDLDADNDGIADTIEARPTAGYLTNDGDVSDDDADGDGIINLFDNNDSTILASVTSTQAGSYTVTASGQVTITITGGDGGDDDGGNQGGSGATVGATFNVTAGDVIQYVVGESGTDDNANGTTTGGPKTAADGGGGGGSTGVYINGELVLVAGGGGGGDNNGDGQGGQVLNVNTTGDGSAGTDTGAGAAGSNGGGGGGNTGDGGGGGGYDTAGGNGNADGGGASSAGLTVVGPETVDLIAGGEGNDTNDGDGGAGFTSGGGADDNDAGGGGGYSGGGAAGNDGTAGGGGSFINTNPGVGYVATVTATAGTNGGGTFADGTLTIVNSAIIPVFGGSFSTPEDTDGDGTADYLDTNSDDDTLLDIDESGLAPGAFDDANGDGIDDAASISASYTDPDGAVNDPAGGANGLANQTGDLTEVGYREQVFPPVINNLDTDLLSYGVGSGPQKIDTSTAVTVTDADSVHFNTGVLTIDTPSNFPAAANEVLTVDGTTGNGITVGGSTISFNGDVIGTIGGAGSDGAAGDPLVITFTTNDATPAAVSALLETINYENTGTTTGASTVTFQVTDDNGDASNTATVNINVTDTLAANPDSAATNEDSPITVSAAAGVLTNDLNAQENTTYVLNYDAATEGALGAIGTWVAGTGTNNITLAGASVVTVNDATNPGLSQAISFTGGGTNATGGTFTSLDSTAGIAGDADVTFDFWLKLDDTTDADVIFETQDATVGTSFVIRDSDMSGDGFDDLSFVITDGYAGGTFSVTADLSAELGAGLTTDYFHVVGTFDQNGGADTMELFINGNSVGTTAANINDWDDGFAAGTAGLGRANGGNAATNLAGAPTYTDFEGDIASFSVYQSDFSQANVDQNLAAKGALTVTGVADSGASATGVNTNFVLASGATVNIQADGSYVYDPNGQPIFTDLNFGDPSVTDTFDYTVTDAAGTSTTQTVTITIEASNEFELSSLSTGGGNQGTIFHGILPGDEAGYVVASAGDVNGDGYDDILFGAPTADPNGSFSGQSYVVFGKSTNFTGEFELSTLDGTNGFILNGIDITDHSGTTLASGDFNGDGLSDIIIGAPSANVGSSAGGDLEHRAGQAYVVYGKTDFTPILTAGVFELSSLVSGGGVNGFVVNGEAEDDLIGRVVANAGDINGDGIDDIALTGHGADPNGANSGQTYLVFGNTDFSSSVLGQGDADTGELEVSTLDGTDGIKFNGQLGDYSSNSVAGAGDIDGDGYDDLIIGAWGANAGAGGAYVVLGDTSANLSALLTANEFELSDLNGGDGSTGFVLNGVAAGDYAGTIVSTAGDINGDGFDDIVVSAPYASPNGLHSGATYLLYGTNGGFASSIDLSTGADVTINGASVDDYSGHSATTAGDVNGDGFDDLLIGRGFNYSTGATDAGESYILFGSSSLAATIELSSFIPNAIGGATDVTVPTGFVLSGIDNNDYSGLSVASAGDVNGDGFDDIIIGAYFGDPNGDYSGESYLIYGKDFRNEGVLVGSSSADVIGGTDTVSGGAGDDTITDPGTTTNTSTIDGGGGVDTLSLTADLNLTLLSNNVYQNIEIIDLGSSTHTLTLNELDLFDLSGSTNILTVNGSGTVSLAAITGSWSMSVDGSYNVYQNGEAIIRILNTITVTALLPEEIHIDSELADVEEVLIAETPRIDDSHSNIDDLEKGSLITGHNDLPKPGMNTSKAIGVIPFSQQLSSVNNDFQLEVDALLTALTS